MNGAGDTSERRRRRRTDIGEVFEDLADQLQNPSQQAVVQHDTAFLGSDDADRAEQLSRTLLPWEIYQTIDWTDGVVGGLQFVDSQSVAPGHIHGQRKRLVRLLSLLNAYMGRHPGLAALGVRDDLRILTFALDALNSGVVHPLVQSKASNKPPSTRIDQEFRAHVIAFVELFEIAGLSRRTAFETVAKELTRAGFRASRPTEDRPSTSFRVETVKRYYFRSRKAEGLSELLNEGEVSPRASIGQSDAAAVFKLINSFTNNAIHVDKVQLPPSVAYVTDVMRATLNRTSFRSLFTHKLGSA